MGSAAALHPQSLGPSLWLACLWLKNSSYAVGEPLRAGLGWEKLDRDRHGHDHRHEVLCLRRELRLMAAKAEVTVAAKAEFEAVGSFTFLRLREALALIPCGTTCGH